MRLRTFAIATVTAALAMAPLAAQSDEPMPTATDPVVAGSTEVQPADASTATTGTTALGSEIADAGTVELESAAASADPATTGLDSETVDQVDPYAAANIPQETANEPSELPRTASPLALLALLGAGGIGSAAGLRLARRR